MSTKKPPTELEEAFAKIRPQFVKAALFSLMTGLMLLAPTGYMLEVYDRVVNSRSHMTLAMLTVLVLAAFVVMELMDWARTEILSSAGRQLDQILSPRIFQAIFSANLRRGPGGTAQPMNDFRTLRDFVSTPVVLAVMESPVSLVFLVLVFAISPVLGWTALVGAMLQTFLAWLNERTTQPPLSEANRAAITAQQYAGTSLRNAQVIEAMGMLRNIHGRWMQVQKEFLQRQAVASESAAIFQSSTKMLQQILSSALLGLGAWLLLRNSLNGGAGMMIIASTLGGRIVAPVVQVVTQWRSVVNAREAWTRLDVVLTQNPAPRQAMELPEPRGALAVEQLTAGAPGTGIPILKGIQFALQPGEVLAVVGPSAAGKTTLARLLVGVWPSLAGKVRLDGADVYAWNKTELGPHVGYLPQGVELIEGTLGENIARFGEGSQTRIEAAAKAVGMHEHIMSLPLGYDTPVGREGAVLSGGERQRVALARALYGDPVLVVLDEPNSSLDEVGDAALARAITERKAAGTTFVVMTHRTSVLAVADKLLVLREGAQQAFGPRDEVLAELQRAAAGGGPKGPAGPAGAPGAMTVRQG
jgi:ATP-binding cassette subfamily C exporter for protease/lipase